jgi:hypothetical protein
VTGNAYTEDQLVEQPAIGPDEGLPRAYTKPLYQAKCTALFEHVYEAYMGDGKSAFSEGAPPPA